MRTQRLFTLITVFVIASMATCLISAQTAIPNGDFESWVAHSSYSNPTYWDTPDSILMSIPIFGQAVVFRSTDHYSGSYSAKLITKNIAIPGAAFDCPGFITLGKLHVDLINQTYSVTGGSPINDRPTHLMGYYKYQPVGGDSCAIGMILYKTVNGKRDTIGGGYFSTTATVNEWTHFSAWIIYDTILTPDTMNIIAISSAQTNMNPNTTLYVDDLYLDYTVGFSEKDPAAGISVYQDKETSRLIVFCEFPSAREVVSRLYNISGQQVYCEGPVSIANGRMVVPYTGLRQGTYILAVEHDGKTFTKKFLLGF